MAQVVGNLLGNAEKYSPPGRPITVRLERTNDEVLIRVSDEGVGVAPKDLPLIFDPFFRAARARALSGGLGLGLAVCKRLMELQGGRIWATPRSGQGTEFGVALPALEDA